jgi:ATP-dependent Clp protease ATP-binding subunit ClpB
MDQLSKIVELRLEDVRRLLAERKISLEITDAAKRQLITQGYDINYGARPLKRAIQRMIQDPLALRILDGEVLNGDHVIVDTTPDGKIDFKVERHAPARVSK